jgi:hypothetical protein
MLLDLTDGETRALARHLNHGFPISTSIRSPRGSHLEGDTRQARPEPLRPLKLGMGAAFRSAILDVKTSSGWSSRREKGRRPPQRSALFGPALDHIGLSSPCPADYHIGLPSAALRTDEPLAPIEDAVIGAVPNSHLCWVRLDLMLARFAPHDKPTSSPITRARAGAIRSA